MEILGVQMKSGEYVEYSRGYPAKFVQGHIIGSGRVKIEKKLEIEKHRINEIIRSRDEYRIIIDDSKTYWVKEYNEIDNGFILYDVSYKYSKPIPFEEVEQIYYKKLDKVLTILLAGILSVPPIIIVLFLPL